MDRHYTSLTTAAALVAMALPIAACNIDIRKHESDGKANVDITTPVGNVSVRTNVERAETGLAVYPGATPLRDDDDPESADVNVGNSMFGIKVIAAKFESPDEQEKIVDFYRNELKAYGEVTECRGDVDFRGPRGARRPECREKFFSHDHLQLVAGPEDQQHIVLVKPRGDGTEFGLVHVQLRGKS